MARERIILASVWLPPETRKNIYSTYHIYGACSQKIQIATMKSNKMRRCLFSLTRQS